MSQVRAMAQTLPKLINYFITWLCLTRTGSYWIHEFDWLKSILTAVKILDLAWLHFMVKKFQTKIQILIIFVSKYLWKCQKNLTKIKKTWRGQANFHIFKFSSSQFTRNMSASKTSYISSISFFLFAYNWHLINRA